MKLLRCPINGPRPLQEFQYGGEFRPEPESGICTDANWADYVFNRNGAPGIKLEWWYHMASGYWFLARRDTERDEIIETFPYEDLVNHG